MPSFEPREHSILKFSFGISLGVFVIIVAAVLLCGATADAATYAVSTSGGFSNWTSPSPLPWTCTAVGPGSTSCGSYPGDPSASGAAAGDIANISGSGGGLTVNSSSLLPVTMNLTCTGCTVDIPSSDILPLVGSSSSSATLSVSGGTLSIPSGSTLSTTALTFSGGTISGAGTTTVTGSASIPGSSVLQISTHTLNLGGATTFTSTGTVRIDQGGTINNSGTFDIQSDGNAFDSCCGGGAATFNNSGTLKKSVGAGSSNFLNAVALNNTGTVQGLSGTLSFNGGGTSTGTFSATSPGTVNFSGGTQNVTLGPANSFSGTGIIGFSGGTTTIGGIGAYNVTGTTQINGGIVNFNINSSTTNLTLNSGVLTGTGTLTVNTSAAWSGAGQMAGGGATTIAPAATLTVTGIGNTMQLSARPVNIQGNTTFTSTGTIRIDFGGTINNSGTFDIQSDGNAFDSCCGGGTATFNNSGTLQKSAGVASSNFLNAVALNNTGTVQGLSGTLSFNGGGTSTGTFSATSPGTVNFSGGTQNVTLGGANSFNGTGTIGFSGGTTTIGGSGSYNVTGTTLINGGVENLNINGSTNNLTLSGGTLGGSGTLTVNTAAAWSGSGGMAGNGATTIAPAATLTVSGIGNTMQLSTRTLNTGGNTTFTSTGTMRIDLGGTINNSGIFDIQSDGNTFDSCCGGGAATFNNSGTLKKSAGAASSNFLNAVALNNSGTVQGLSGTLSFNGGGTSTGTFSATSPGTLNFAGGTQNVTLGPLNSFSGTGTIGFSGGTTTIGGSGSYNVTGTTLINGGVENLNINGSTNNLTLSGGTLGGSGTLTVNTAAAWSGSGGMAGNGATTIAPAATLTVSGIGNTMQLSTRTVNIQGNTTFTSTGTIRIDQGGTINNGGTFDIRSSGNTFDSCCGGGTATFNNSGTLQKSAGLGISNFLNAVALNNSGTVQVLAAVTLSLNGGGTSTGTFTATAPGILTFGGGTQNITLGPANAIGGSGYINFAGGTTNIGGSGTYAVTGTGVTELNGGTVNINIPASTSSLFIYSGTLGGSGTITATGGSFWAAGNMIGTGTTTIAGSGTFAVSGGSVMQLSTRTLNLIGNTTSDATGTIRIDQGGTINNSGIFDIQSDGNIFDSCCGGGAATFVNSGTLKKSAGPGTSSFLNSVALNNNGTVQGLSGTLSFNGGGTSTGTFSATSPGTVNFSGGTQNVTLGGANSFNGTGTIGFSGGTTTIGGIGAYNVTGTTLINGGVENLNINGSTNNLNLSGGTLGGSGTLTVNGAAAWSGSGGMAGNGATTIAPAATLTVSGIGNTMQLSTRSLNTGGNTTFTSTGTIRIDLGGTINNIGIFDIHSDGNTFDSCCGGGAATFNNSGTLKKSAGAAGSNFLNAVALNNTGIVGVATGTLAFNGPFTQTAGTTTVGPGGLVFGSPMNLNGGVLNGNGTITGTVANNGGAVNPGTSPGMITINGGYTQGASGTLNIELQGLTAGTQYDQLNVTGTPGSATLNGTLNVTLLGGYTPNNGDTFQPLTFVSRSGDFATKNLPTFGSGGTIQASYVSGPPQALQLLAVAPPPAVADVVVTQSASPTSILDGQTTTFTITVGNNGPNPAAGITIADSFSGGTFSSVNATAGTTCSGTGPITCTIANLNFGATETINLVVTGSSVGTITNNVTESATTSDSVPGNNAPPAATVTVSAAADLSIGSVTGAPNPVNAAQTETWVVPAANGGPDAASSAVINISLAGGTINSATSSNPAFTCTNTTNNAQCTAASFASGGSTNITLISTAQNQAGTMTLSANISSTTADPVSGNNSGSASVTVAAVADVGVLKTLSGALVAGQTATYTITVGNTGPSDAVNVQVSDTTPAGLTFVSNAGACATPYPCSLGTLTTGSSVMITTTYSVPANASGTVSNTASATTSTTDSNAANNSSTTTTPVVTKADLSITKTLSGSLVAGQSATYTIIVTNNGPSDAQTVSVTDPTPAGLSFVSNSDACTSAFPCSIGTLTAGQSAKITSGYNVASSATGTITNTATVKTTSTDSNLTNNSSSASDTVSSSADLAVTKSGPTNNPGSSVAYSITVTNFGPADAVAVTVTDPTPDGLSMPSVSGDCSSFPCSLGTMTVGQVHKIQSQYNVVTTGAFTNTVTVSSATNDPQSSNNSASVVTTQATCPTNAPSNLKPYDGATNVLTGGTLSWDSGGAGGFNVYLGAVGGGCSKLIGGTSGTSLTYAGLNPGTTYEWRVEAVGPGCPAKSTACIRFTTAAVCANAPVTLIGPLNATVSSPVTFTWSAAQGATNYKLFVNGSQVTSTSATSYATSLPDGTATWFVIADFPLCPSLPSQSGSFTACNTSVTPNPSVVSTVNSGDTFTVKWDSTGAPSYEIDEATEGTFANAKPPQTVHTPSASFQHTVTTATAYFYRVRAFIACANAFGPNSATVQVVVTPGTPPSSNPNQTVPVGTTGLVTVQVHIDGLPGQTLPFTAALDNKPWLVRVEPASGTLPPEGLPFLVYVDPSSLPNGTFTGTVILTVVTPGKGPVVNGVTTISAPVSISLVTPVKVPLPGGTPPPNSLIVASVGHLDGVNSKWVSDIAIGNVGTQKISYQLTFSPQDASKGQKQTVVDVDAGSTIALDDMIKTWYGVGVLGDGANGVLEIRPLDAKGKGLQPDDVSVSLATVASSRTTNVGATGNLSEFIPATKFSSFIGRTLDPSHTPSVLSMQQIGQSDTSRMNLGVVEASGLPASVLVSVFDPAGTRILDYPLDLKGGEQRQLNSFLAQNRISLPDGRIEVKVTNGEGKITAYASMIDNKSGAPILISGVPVGQSNFDHFVLPGAANLNSATGAWHTDLRIFNPGPTAQSANVTFYPQAGSAEPKTAAVTINAGEVKGMDNVLSSLFGLSDTGGAIHVTTDNAAPLEVTARTYNQTPDGIFAEFVPAVTEADSIGKGDRALQILQAEESVRSRINLGVAEVSGKPATVEVSVYVPESKFAVSTQIPLAANGFLQVPVIRSLGLTNVYNARISVRVIDGDGRIGAYGSLIDQKTGAPAFIPAQK